MKFYSYDVNRRPLGSGECQIGKDGQPLIPARSTLLEPPVAEDGYYVAWGKDQWVQIRVPVKTEGQIALETREVAKIERQALVDAIKVTTTTGKTFDGDETSQTRMSRAIFGMQATGQATITWVLADNTVTQATLAELTEALCLAGARQAELWVI